MKIIDNIMNFFGEVWEANLEFYEKYSAYEPYIF